MAVDLIPEEAMSAFLGENPNGVWRLTVIDTAFDGRAPSQFTDKIAGWTLTLDTPAVWNLTQSVTAPPLVQPGSPLAFTATIGNAGPDAAPGPVQWTLQLPVSVPPAVRFASITAAGWTCVTPAVGQTG